MVGLRVADYDHGVGKAHSAVDAWIDDLRKWVLLDAQNAAFWAYDADPLGPVELQAALHRGDPRPVMVGCESEADFWWPYMHTVSVVGGAVGDFRWSSASFCPIFQDRFLLQTAQLHRSPELLYPNLGAVGIGITGSRSQPELTLATSHPYAVGFRVDGDDVEDSWPFDLSLGEHNPAITLITSYGEVAAGRMRYRVTV